MNVISLFNGMGTLRQALHNLDIKVDKYYSSEIKKYAIELQQHHFPDVIQVGDINNWKHWDIDWKSIDFIGSGSPCQDLSAAGKRAGINGSRSNLFFVFIDILNHVKKLNPNVKFLQENVGSAPKLDIGIMSRALGVYPVRINSSLVTAQLRDRYYWSNIRTKQDGMFGDLITDIPQPKDRKILFEHIITNGVVRNDKSNALLQSEVKTFFYKDQFKFNELIKRRLKQKKQLPNLIYIDTDKHTCLNTGSGCGRSQKSLHHRNKTTGMTTLITDQNLTVRTVNQIEMERLQGFPDGYCSMMSKTQGYKALGNSFTVPVIKYLISHALYESESNK